MFFFYPTVVTLKTESLKLGRIDWLLKGSYLPLWVGLFLFACPSCAVFGNERDVGIVAFVLRLQTGQVGRGWHTPCRGNFTKRLQAMAGGN